MVVSEERLDATMRVRGELLRLAESNDEADVARYEIIVSSIRTLYWSMEKVCRVFDLGSLRDEDTNV